MATRSDVLAKLGIVGVGFEYEQPAGTARVANPMYTHYSWLAWRLDPRFGDHIDAEQDAAFWATVPQLSRRIGWNGPAVGVLSSGGYAYAPYGGLRVYGHLEARLRDQALRFPDLIRHGAGIGDLVDLYLDSLAEHLRYIDPEQLPLTTSEFIVSRSPYR